VRLFSRTADLPLRDPATTCQSPAKRLTKRYFFHVYTCLPLNLVDFFYVRTTCHSLTRRSLKRKIKELEIWVLSWLCLLLEHWVFSRLLPICPHGPFSGSRTIRDTNRPLCAPKASIGCKHRNSDFNLLDAALVHPPVYWVQTGIVEIHQITEAGLSPCLRHDHPASL